MFIAAIAGLALACNNEGKAPVGDSTSTSTAPAPAATDSSSSASLKEGLMTMKDNKVMIVKSGAWAPLDSTVTCTNGRKVSVDGTVSKGDKKRKLEEGMMIDKDGQLMDKNGKPMDTSGWD